MNFVLIQYFQVLAHRPLGQPGAGKYRLKITDGRYIYRHVVLNNSVSRISVPEKFSVIRITNSEVPGNVNPHSIIMAIPGNKFALLLRHYTTLRSGAEAGSQIQVVNGVNSGASLTRVMYKDEENIMKIKDSEKIKIKQRAEQTKIIIEIKKEIAKEINRKTKLRNFLWSKF